MDSGSSTTPSIATSDETASVCHVLPCNIEFTGMAPTHTYFHSVDQASPNDGFSTSMFRGRGLVARNNEGIVHGHLISLQSQQNLQVKGTFNKMMEWHHEYHPDILKTMNTNNSRVHTAHEWLQISNAVHEILPINDDE